MWEQALIAFQLEPPVSYSSPQGIRPMSGMAISDKDSLCAIVEAQLVFHHATRLTAKSYTSQPVSYSTIPYGDVNTRVTGSDVAVVGEFGFGRFGAVYEEGSIPACGTLPCANPAIAGFDSCNPG